MNPPRHPSRAHLVAVTTAGDEVRGSGYLLNSRLVLTAGHVVKAVGSGEVRVCRMLTLRSVSAEVVRTEGDVVLLLLAEDLADPGELSDVEIAALTTDARFDDCAALGLPAVMTRISAGVAPLEPAFRVAPNTADGHGYLSLELIGHPPEGAAPWSGMSGAPVFHAGRWLVGVVLRDSAGWAHSRLEAAPVDAFREAVSGAALLAGAGAGAGAGSKAHIPGRDSRPITEFDARDATFLDSYRREVIRRYGHIELFGLGLRGLEDDIGIEHAYVSLRAGLPTSGPRTPDQARPVELLLPRNPRILLRGDPGAGKSTLLEWLAVSMARGSCHGPLEPLNHRVPFLLRLRDMYAPRWKKVEGLDGVPPEPERFLDFNRMATGTTPPDGWIRRMFDRERALLLVDGLDEVLETHRDGVIDWIGRLLRDHPRLHIVVTGRPEALRDWPPPQRLGFAELKLLELNGRQRAELIKKWHEAAALGVQSYRLTDEERDRRVDRLVTLEEALTKHINDSADLAALAATPLLCAVLCKLHEVHGTRLPRFRQELYARTIDMMLGLRDADREVPDPLPHLDVDQRRAILSWVAGYLTTEGEREITPERFDEKVRDRLRSLGRDAGTHSAEEIRKALEKRSGLLVALSEDTLRFSHRTFQDYLAATDMVAQRAFGQLARHTGDETWDDVLHFAMSQCNLADTGEFVAQIRRKLRLVTDSRQRTRMRMAAASCIPYAVQMSEGDRRALVSGVAKSFRGEAKEDGGGRGRRRRRDLGGYSAVGPDLLAILREGFDWKDLQLCHDAILLAESVGGPEALRFLARIPYMQRQKLSSVLVSAWDRFPGPEYADEVLAGLALDRLTGASSEQLAHARVVGPVDTLVVFGPIPTGEIAAFADEHGVRHLVLIEGAVPIDDSLAALSGASALQALSVGHHDLTVPGLFARGSSRGRFRRYYGPAYALTALPALAELSLSALPVDWTEQAAAWTSLSHLGLFHQAVEGLALLADLPALTHLVVDCEPDCSISPGLVHAGVTHLFLMLDGVTGELDLTHLPSAFPALTELVLTPPPPGHDSVDLSCLENMAQLRIRLKHFTSRQGQAPVRGAFPPGRLIREDDPLALPRTIR